MRESILLKLNSLIKAVEDLDFNDPEFDEKMDIIEAKAEETAQKIVLHRFPEQKTIH
ncbi:hypothetical protein OU789_02600 [Halocynthiibacter sp. C4]|uniref:hypothetical protein n=1 Tax=Halocynthiibacter sp. C4 TaxID=2992758 RepID=UPI00237A568A|nr:hypothetical protein [Halocynthiibacter sp. C4]MDE0588812.1 hypothetical protein [Halocynthiibacter sp. C4]